MTLTSAQNRRQMNVRLHADLIEQIDARRATLRISRDEWISRAIARVVTDRDLELEIFPEAANSPEWHVLTTTQPATPPGEPNG